MIYFACEKKLDRSDIKNGKWCSDMQNCFFIFCESIKEIIWIRIYINENFWIRLEIQKVFYKLEKCNIFYVKNIQILISFEY